MSGLNDMHAVFASLPPAASGAAAPPSSPEPCPRPVDPRCMEPPPLVPKRRTGSFGRFEVSDNTIPLENASSSTKWEVDHLPSMRWTEADDAAYLASILDGKHATSEYVAQQIITGVLSAAFEPLIEKQEVRRMLFANATPVA